MHGMFRKVLLGAMVCAFASACSDSGEPPPTVASAGAGNTAGAGAGTGPSSSAGAGSGGAPAGGGATAAAGAPPTAGSGSGAGGLPAGGSAGSAGAPPVETGPFAVLVFSGTSGFRHDSIPDGVALLEDLGAENDFTVDNTEDSADFSDANLANYAVVVFMSSHIGVLSEEARGAFQRFIQGGGGYVGVHCASCGADDWPWYAELLGATFTGHPAIQVATVNIESHDHPSTAGLPDVWERNDELYNFDMNPRGAATVLMTLDESSYDGGSMGDDHPITWHHEFEGGRSWYTGLGHPKEGYAEENFVKMLLGGVLYAAGR